jgi:hypothetical protein
MNMRHTSLAASVITIAMLCIGVQAASASTHRTVPAKQLTAWKTLDGPFAAADNKWSNALSSLSSNPTVAQISRPSLAFVPALKTFDTGLKKIGFTGGAGTEIADVVKLNSQLVTDLSSIKSVSSFESEFRALNQKYQPVQSAFAKDLGIPTADVII